MTHGRAHLLGAGLSPLVNFTCPSPRVGSSLRVAFRGPTGIPTVVATPLTASLPSQKLPLAREHVPDPSRQMVGSKQASVEARVRGPGFDSFRMWWKTTLGANAVDCGRLFETDK